MGQGGIVLGLLESQLDRVIFLQTPAQSIRWNFQVTTRGPEDKSRKIRKTFFLPLWPAFGFWTAAWVAIARYAKARRKACECTDVLQLRRKPYMRWCVLGLGLLAMVVGSLGALQRYLDPNGFYSAATNPWLYFPSIRVRVIPSLELATERGILSASIKLRSTFGWITATSCSATMVGVSFCYHTRTGPLTSIMSEELFAPTLKIEERINDAQPGTVGWTINISLLIWGGAIVFLCMIATMRRVIENKRRKSLGLCQDCGYDLRGSSERCPECGKELCLFNS